MDTSVLTSPFIWAIQYIFTVVFNKIDNILSTYIDALNSIGCIDDGDETLFYNITKQTNKGISKIDILEYISVGMFKLYSSNTVYNTSCPISTEDFEPTTEIAVLACGHGFIPNNIIEWLEYSPFCPICRCRIKPFGSYPNIDEKIFSPIK